jgi:hypothetical protein
MMAHPLAGPVALLLAWSVLMMIWMYATRIPAMRQAGIDLKNRVGGGGRDLDAVLPPDVQWKSHNYNHLMEQPTLFYATCLLLIITGHESLWVTNMAWGYVGLRIAHSIVQSTSNRVRYRFLMFALASICLIGLVGYTVGVVLGG